MNLVTMDGSALPDDERLALFQRVCNQIPMVLVNGPPRLGDRTFSFVLPAGITTDNVRALGVPGNCSIRSLQV